MGNQLKSAQNTFRSLTSSVLFGLMMMVLAAMPPSGDQAVAQDPVHIVKAGETLFQISRSYNLDIDQLRLWNNLSSDLLSVGQRIRLRPQDASRPLLHQVAAGETLFSISKKYGVSLAELRAWNGLEGSDLRVGQELSISSGKERAESEEVSEGVTEVVTEVVTKVVTEGVTEVGTEPVESIVRSGTAVQKTQVHLVKSGENLTLIAQKYSMSVAELRRLNDLTSDRLGIGQRLVVHEITTAPPSVAGADETLTSTPQGKFILYTIQRDDNAASLAETFELSLSQLQALNPESDLTNLRTGRQLTVLLPPSRPFPNPYLKNSQVEHLGTMNVFSYAPDERAQTTTSGELYHPDELTAAHASLPLGSVIFVRSEQTDRGSYIRINDRHTEKGLKLSRKAFDILEIGNLPENDRRVTVHLEEM